MADPDRSSDELHVRCLTPDGRVHNIVSFTSSGLALPLLPPGKLEEVPFLVLYVLEDGPDEPQELLMAQPRDRADAQRMASEIAQEIEQGVFDPATW